MLARKQSSAVEPVSSDRLIHLPIVIPLSARVGAALVAMPMVTSVAPDLFVEALVLPLGPAPVGLVLRRARLNDGRVLTITAVPTTAWICPEGKAHALNLKRTAAKFGRRVMLVPQGVLEHQPRIAEALLVTTCAGMQVASTDRLTLMSALIDAGGSMPLADAASLIVRSSDPVAAVLGLVANRIVGLDLSVPIGPASAIVALPGRGCAVEVC